MQHQWLSRRGTDSLILLFGGWALGASAFAGMGSDADALLVHDYRDLDDPLPEVGQYDHVDLVAFSFGVASAVHWMSAVAFLPERLVAISGTLSPADVDRGIAPEMIRATADSLSDDGFARFCRRAGLAGPAPAIDIVAARAELHAVIDRGPAPDHPIDRIWIPGHDRIIPTQAQETAWKSQEHSIRRCPGSHIPFGPEQNWAEWIR